MSDTYEKDIIENLGDARNLILLGVRADADIDYRDKKIKRLLKRSPDRNKVIEEYKEILKEVIDKGFNAQTQPMSIHDYQERITEITNMARAALEAMRDV